MAVPDFPHVCLKEVRVQAFTGPIIDFPLGFHGGPVLERDEHRIFRHDRAGKPVDSFRDDARYEDRLRGDHVYAGPVHDHFGHFMAEMAHRIIPAQLLGLPARYLFVAGEGRPDETAFDALPVFIREFLAFCGVAREAVTVVNRNTIVERLHLVQQGTSLGSYPRPGYGDALAAYTTPRLDALYGGIERPERLYVSRSALSKIGSFLGEAHVERQLIAAGYHVFRPERHSLTEQLDHYRKASRIVFPGGSACHGTELLGTRMLGEVMLFPRLFDHSDLFRRVLKPRARLYAEADVSVYLGSLLLDRGTREESIHRGVSVFDLDRLAAAGGAFDAAFPKQFAISAYARSAAVDMVGYWSAVRADKQDRNTVSKASLMARLGREVLAMHRRRRAGAVAPGAAEPVLRILTDREIADVWRACAALTPPYNALVRAVVLTLQPQSWVAAMLWSDLSRRRDTWTVPDAQADGGAPRQIPVSQALRAILSALPLQLRTDHVFHRKGQPVKGLAHAKRALDLQIVAARAREAARAGRDPEPLAAWSLRDLRRTGMLRLIELGHDEDAVRDLVGLRSEEDEVPCPGTPPVQARIMEVWGTHVLASQRLLVSPEGGHPQAQPAVVVSRIGRS